MTRNKVLLGLGAVFTAAVLGSCSKFTYDATMESKARTEAQAKKDAALPQHVFYAPDQYKAAIAKMNELKGTGCVFSFTTGSGKHADKKLWLYPDFNRLGDCADLAQKLAQGRDISYYKFYLKGHQKDQVYANGQCGWREGPPKKPYCYAISATNKYFIEVR